MVKPIKLSDAVKKPEGLKQDEEQILTDAYRIIKMVPRLSKMPAEKRKLWAEGYSNGVLNERRNVNIKSNKVDLLVETLKDPKRDKNQDGEQVVAEILSFLEA